MSASENMDCVWGHRVPLLAATLRPGVNKCQATKLLSTPLFWSIDEARDRPAKNISKLARQQMSSEFFFALENSKTDSVHFVN
jgi:hypothetical protein